MTNNDTPFLVVIETQKVKDYLFASPFLRETRGASLLLDLLNRKKIGKILLRDTSADKKIIYLGGGSGKVLFKTRQQAQDFQEEVLNQYRHDTVNARVTVEIVERDAVETIPKLIRRGVGECRKQKLGRTEGIPLIAGRWLQPCTSCGAEPAEGVKEEWGEHRLCRACWLKRKEVNQLYKKVKPKGKPTSRELHKLKPVEELIKRYTKNFVFTTLAQEVLNRGFQLVLPQDFDDLGQASHPSNYMGFIYADGNRMGYWVKKIAEIFQDDQEAKEAYRAFSEIIDRATREAAVAAVLEEVALQKIVLEPDTGPAYYLPAEIILAGGDDLMLAVPAHNVLDVAVRLLEVFQEKSKTYLQEWKSTQTNPKDFAPEGFTTSAGIVLAHAHYPARDLMTLAADLMKIAKKKAAELAGNGQETGTLDFLVLSEAGTEPVKDRRKWEYTQKPHSNLTISLTERPYTVADARKLLQSIRALKEAGAPRTKLKALYAVLFQNHLQAQFDALTLKARLKSTGALEGNKLLRQLVTEHKYFPYKEEHPGKWTTTLADLMELYDFIHPHHNGSHTDAPSPEQEERYATVGV